ncbi:anthranilate synthase component I family protein [Patulibacter minatonensis]|uniref:anthranilate synthase component I family protein n=1 Tax=Patulibacter minatonensis TaxID=298163 RepID=UPI00047E924C|nr:chorismate-binding protein [Patulibacter minatonensis]
MPVAPDLAASLARAEALGLQLRPTLDEALALAVDHDVVPVLAQTIDDVETPVSAYLKLRAAHPGEPSFLLESAEQGRVGRFSFLGVRPARTIEWSLGDPGDPYAMARDAIGRRRVAQVDGLPPFVGGAVGVFAFDLVRTVEPLADPNPDVLGTPDLALQVTDAMVVFDGLLHTITALAPLHTGADATAEGPAPATAGAPSGVSGSSATGAATAGTSVDDGTSGPAAGAGATPAGRASDEVLTERYATAAARIVELREALLRPTPPGRTSTQDGPLPVREAPEWVSNHSREAFEAMVARIIEYVRAGDAFQVVPSQRWTAELGIDPFSVYRGLRVVNPSPYMYYLDFGDWQVVGASPEPLVTVRGREISMRPIAGTRPRGGTPAEDAELAEGMLADEKERAEHVMLVDLSRNDLGRVCEYGTVTVDELMVVETYSHVLHIVSAVSGTLRPEVAATDALRSVLPAGTLSGAPKVRAMQIIDELEPVKRGGYGGAVGYLSWSGDLDSCIHIRTAVFKDGTAHVQAGGGTVADALPAYEFEESVNKSRAIRRAVEVALAQPDWA